ncbi:MAG: Transcription elongation factor GreA [candidate division WS6 bacterium GW2011_GWF2_39_15]|uniref:Transcription elongation factor GreA n=1 Tax=candidate division WS6 bacterium GW2011_GWF2_39_15 TaxID=1619100 RepID=A0A0G0QVP7_9BACT|nr:MAG: Transcription elongation factor GreA [candidate division WS6 bacterium GW2011_GWF2_39_15]
MKNEYLVTSDGLKKLKEELKYRETEKRSLIQKTLEEMRAQGDLSENDGYSLAVEDSKTNEAEIMKLKNMIANAKTVKNDKKNTVEIGDTVTIVDDEGKKMVVSIVGESESNPIENKVSHNSPLGKALVGKKINTKVTVETPRGKKVYTILKEGE